MNSFAVELATKTQIYWEVSQVWNGRNQAELETGTAIEICNTLTEQINPQRPIFRSAGKLLDEIISGEGHKATTTKVIPFKRPPKKVKQSATRI